MPRLCILTQYFPPEMGAPQARLSELGELLAKRGWSVEVLTALPNYPTGRMLPGYSPWRPVRERVGSLETVRVPLYPSRRGFLKRLGTYLSFAASAMHHGPRLCGRPDLLFVESPPLFLGLTALYLARRWRCPYVLNVSDLWPESAIRMGVVSEGVATDVAGRLERHLYRRAAGVTGQSEEIVAWVRARAPDTPTQVITNGVDPARFAEPADDGARALLGPEPGPIFIYAGLLGLAQGLDQVLDIAAALPRRTPGRFILIGDGPVREQLGERIARERLTRVRLLPAQPRDRIPSLLAAADVAVVTHGLRLPGAVPSKLYEAMAAGLPVLLVAEGEAVQRLERAACGLAAPPGDLAGALAAARRLAEDPGLRRELGEAGRSAARDVYDRRRIAELLDRFLHDRLACA